jgi:hypothetical protein
MEKKEKKITEIEELENELRIWKLKLEIQQTKSHLIDLKASMNAPDPVSKPRLGVDPF